METKNASIWYRRDTCHYILCSPKNGISNVLEMYVGVWGSGTWQVSRTYNSMEDLEIDAVHFEVVTQPGLRNTLLETAVEFINEQK